MINFKYIIPFYREFQRLITVKYPITYWDYIFWRLFQKKTYWYKQRNCIVNNSRNIYVGINSNIGRPGNYIQGEGKIYIGDYVRIATNVGLLTANHDLYDHNKSKSKPIKIGDYSWIGMNAIITSGVELGPRTIVGAGAVVTKSYPEGFCVLAGNPAVIIKTLDKNKFVPWHYKYEFYGLIPKDKFEAIRKKYIDV